MRALLQDFVNLFYPQVCLNCHNSLMAGEELLCIRCRSQLPLAYHDLKSDDKMQRLFIGRTPVEQSVSLFYYEKIGAIQHMIHALKYQGREEVGTFMGQWLTQLLIEDGILNDVDVVVPVPVHPKRKRLRGYNQVTKFGKCLSDGLDVSFRESVLLKKHHTKKQAQLSQTMRSDETQSPYVLQEHLPEGSHVLLVDDVITTGTTLSLCCRELAKISNVRISIATMAISV
ncbi:ComF family protein [Nonlabens ponticola]|uniref:ComF family protein n=1 Tax=Nonlabens ponticola TaxID=2496866 RepID=A0A3S9MVG2_9FLAO|nr:phosphoribosyltransferase family protein [Nonlabens ponticola]AZQ43103.1 ComF family protein [Nonlabens ponticola]